MYSLQSPNFIGSHTRTDGGYSDGRHPDGVRFVRSIREDLARRDFTVGAMAWHPERGLFDPFGGQNDLKNRILRAGVDEEIILISTQ